MADRTDGWRTNLRERRKWRRYKVNWPFRMKGTDATNVEFMSTGILHDISVSGAFGYAATPPQVGMKLQVSIRLPVRREGWMKYSAEVVRVESGPHGAGVAIRFRTIRPVFTVE